MEFTEPAMRPPQEAHSLLVRATQGCTYNKCNFCYVSRGYPFMAVKPDQLEADVAAMKAFYPATTRIYMTGSNPFALPTRKLREYLEVFRRQIPRFERVSLQSRIDDIDRKTDPELRELLDLGLSHLYIGTENGNEDVLKLMNKGHTAQDTVTQLKRLTRAGFTFTNFYVLGLGGKGSGVASGKATAAMFNKARPQKITTTGMTLFPGTPVAAMAARGEFTEASEREKIEELLAFLTDLESDTFYDGVHYLNPLNYRFHNRDSEQKARVLADIRDVLASHTDAELELMVNRKRMISL